MEPEARSAFTVRIQEYMLKAAKEAKWNTSWINPSQPYDEALRSFVARILDPARRGRAFGVVFFLQTAVGAVGLSAAAALLERGVPVQHGRQRGDPH